MFNPEKQFAHTQSEYMSTAVLPNAVKYSQLQPRATSGRGQMRRYQSSNGQVFNPLTNNIIRIDVTGDKYSFLDGQHGFLEITMQTTAATAISCQLDSGLWAIVQSLRIESNTGVEIERINNYNLLHTKLFQYQTPSSHLPISNATSGTVSGMAVKSGALGIVTVHGENYLPTQNLGGAASVGAAGSALFLAAGDAVTLTMPLISGFLSNNGGKYIPIGSSSGFTIEITLETANTALMQIFGGVLANAYTVTNCTYNVPIVYITGQEFQSNWVQLLNATGGVAWAGQTWSSHVNAYTGTGAADQIVIPINERCRSLNSIITIFRTTANTVLATGASLSNSQIGNAGAAMSYQYRIAEQLFPPTLVQFNPTAQSAIPTNAASLYLYAGQNVSQAYCEVLKALGMLHNKNDGNLVTIGQYASVEAQQGLGMFGVDVEAYLADSGVSESGIDTASTAAQSSFEANVTFAAAANRIDTFCMKTAIYHLSSDGTFSVSQ